MSLILNIETSTSVCSVALSEGEEVVFEKASFEGPSHAALLGVYMEEALEAAKSKGIKLDAVAVSSGPGSYTGLRIGVSVAKGLCFGKGSDNGICAGRSRYGFPSRTGPFLPKARPVRLIRTGYTCNFTARPD